MQKTILITAILLAVGTSIVTQVANIISVNYTPEANAMFPEDLAGAPGVRVGNWNNAFTGAANTPLDLPDGWIFDDQGTVVSGVSMTLFTGNAGSTTQRGNPPGGTAPELINDGRMFRAITEGSPSAERRSSSSGMMTCRTCCRC